MTLLAVHDGEGHIPSLVLQSLIFIILAYFSFQILQTYVLAIYNVYFHPLRDLPGPKLWIAFPFFAQWALLVGTINEKIYNFHVLYGDTVRWGANQVTFTNAQAWKDIYGHGHPELAKAIPPEAQSSAPKIIVANAQDHFRYRRAMLPAFSDKSLRQQESLIKVYVDLLVQRLGEVAASGEKTNMVLWYNLTTFDLINDLAFGESFGGLERLNAHFWVGGFDTILRVAITMLVISRYPLVYKPLMWLASSKIEQAQEHHRDAARKLTYKRLADKSMHGRGDFMDTLMRSRNQKHGLDDDELVSSADVMIAAGSETTATLLSGVTYWLLRTPAAMKKVVKEVRSAFENEADINFTSASTNLPYMLACLDEALRLYPPVPGVLVRRTNRGPPTEIAGHMIPEDTVVGVHQTSAYWSASNFVEPRSFIPERWLAENIEDPTSMFYNDSREVHKPFSFGPRDCIGRNLAYHEMRLILAKVLWHYDLELCEESLNWEKQKTFELWRKKPLMCKLKRRLDI